MCGGVCYEVDEKTIITYFPNPKALLPVRLKTGESLLMPWGRRKQQPGKLPLGGWAREESLQTGIWDKYFPKPVKISVIKFREKDIEGISHWFDVTHGQYIQGIIAQDDDERRIYVVTVASPPINAIHDRWPKITASLF